jgi:toxin ParE1/3/4
LEISERDFGPRARVRYSNLITMALDAIRTDPQRPGAISRPEIGPDIYTFHLAHIRRLKAADRVRRPRHLVLFRLADPQTILVGRLLHDSMDMAVHVPPDFFSGTS